ncbi:hypothetical protein D9M69_646110 [compost metagenome]
MIGDQIAEGQAQLGIAVDCSLAAQPVAVQFQRGTVIVRVYGGETATYDEVPGLVCLGERRGDSEGQKGSSEPEGTHDELHDFRICIVSHHAKERGSWSFDSTQ